MFWPEKCFICEARTRSRISPEQERQLVQFTEFSELAANLGRKNSEMNEVLTGTKLTVAVAGGPPLRFVPWDSTALKS